MEKKLAEYRAAKEKENLKLREINSKTILSRGSDKLQNRTSSTTSSESEADSRPLVAGSESPTNDLDTAAQSEKKVSVSKETSQSELYLQRVILVLKLILWCVLMTVFVKLQFGAVFFVISCFYLIWTNFRSKPKKKGELSAYSVFNPNYEVLDGTLTAQQFESELKFGSGSLAR